MIFIWYKEKSRRLHLCMRENNKMVLKNDLKESIQFYDIHKYNERKEGLPGSNFLMS
jgi:hypothetical protein